MSYISFYLYECKFRLFYIILCFCCTLVAICFEIQPVFYHILKPLRFSTIVITDLFEFWQAMILVGLFFSFIFSVLFTFYHLWAFLSPGLYKKASSFLFFLFICNGGLSVLSILFFFYCVVPLLVDFIFYGHKHFVFLDIHCFPKLYSFILSIIKTYFFLFFIMQFPGIFWMLLEYDIISPHFFFIYRKVVYVIILFISAFLAPPEMISQLFISFCFVGLYEIFVFFSFWYAKKKETLDPLGEIGKHDRLKICSFWVAGSIPAVGIGS